MSDITEDLISTANAAAEKIDTLRDKIESLKFQLAARAALVAALGGK